MPDASHVLEGTVTVLSTDLVGSTRLNQQLGDEAASAIERELQRDVLDRVERHRGVLLKDTGDGLMAAFQSARRAVACAREVQLAMAQRNRRGTGRDGDAVALELRIGLHTGEVIEKSDSLGGETLIIAKRIESVTPPGEILASEAVHAVLGTARHELVDQGEFELKGIDSRWRLYVVPRLEEAPSGPLADSERSPYVGRAAERERLRSLVARTVEGAGGLVLVSGEAGAGKTRLAQETAAAAGRRGANVLLGHCLDMEAPPPYQPLIEQLEQAARAAAPDVFRRALGDNAPEVAKLMPELRQRYSDIPEPPALPPDQERRYVLHGVAEFIERAARTRPLLLVFEDLQWADESTLLLLESLAQRLDRMPVLILGTYRDSGLETGRPFARALEHLLRARAAEEIALRRLTESEVAALVQGRAGEPPPAALVSLIYSETEGNPFFVEEIFRHLRQSGKLFDEQGRWRAGIEISDTEVPRGVRLVIGRRLEQVSEECRLALTAGAVAGRAFSFELLARVAGLQDEALVDALEEAAGDSLIADQSVGREARYAFAHEQIRQTLLNALSLPRRQRLHARIASGLEELYGSRAAARAVELAHHLYQAGAAADPERTAHYLELAGRNALASLAFEDALRHFDTALEVLESGDRAKAAELMAERARAFRGMARVDSAFDALAAALELAPSGPLRDAILYQRAGLHVDLFQGGAALEDLEPLLEAARAAGDREAELRVTLTLARARYVLALDDPEHARASRDAYGEAYRLAKQLGDKHSMARALIPTQSFNDFWTDYWERAAANNAEALALADELGDEELWLDAETARLAMHAAGAEDLERLRARLEVRRDPLRLKEVYFRLMWIHFGRAEFERCVETCDRGIELAEQIGSAPVQYGTIKALALTDLGRFDQVEAALAQEVADDAHPFGQACQQLARAVYLDRLEAWDAAEEVARDALERALRLSRIWMQGWLVSLMASLAARMGERGDALRAHLARSDAAAARRLTTWAAAERALAEGDAEQVRKLTERALPSMTRRERHRELVLTLEVLARAWLALGQPEQAAELAGRGLQLAERAGFESLIWRLRGCRAEALDASGGSAEAADERARAREEFATLASRIGAPELRAAFEHQPLARSWFA